MLQVGEKELLMLLLMVQSQFEKRHDGRERGVIDALDEGRDLLVNRLPVGLDLRYGRSGQEPAGRPRPAGARRLIVRIEEVSEVRVEGPIVRDLLREDEGLEEPGRVC
jgi:hypothetical protein